MLLIFLLICFPGDSTSSNSIIAEKKCKDEDFPKPYVLLYHSKGGSEIGKLETQGIMDLREAIHSYICVNGAAIVYSGASTHKGKGDSNGGSDIKYAATVKPGETMRYSNGTFRVFAHKCMHINRIPQLEMERMKSSNIKPEITSSSKVLGIKITGIFLLTSKEPYDPANPPLKIMLNRKHFGYKIGADENVINDASFVVQGKGPYCLSLKDGSKIVLTTNAQDDKEICRWSRHTHKEADKKYKQLLKRGNPIEDYKWEDCPSDLKLDDNNTADEQNLNGSSLKPFATMDPTNHSANSKQGGKQASGQGSTGSGVPRDPNVSSEETGDPPQNPIIYSIQVEDCVMLPTFNATDPLCEFIKPDNYNCEKLSVALELEAGADDNTGAAGSPPANVPLTLSGNPLLKWKHEVLTIIASIFSKICIPIRKQSVFQLMNVIGNYIATAHTADPENTEPNNEFVKKTTVWDILIAGLNRCLGSNKTVPMEWEWSESVKSSPPTTIRKRKKREIPEKLNLKALLFEESVPPESLDDEEEDKLIIQRSASIFDFDDKDEATNEMIFAEIPRFTRQTPSGLEKLPLPTIQEYIPPKSSSDEQSTNQLTYEHFMFHPDPSKIRIKGKPNKQIFYYEDMAHYEMDLNVAIDAFWKVLVTVVGFCQQNEVARESAVFPILMHNLEEYFLNLIEEQWKNPSIEIEVDMVAGEFMDEDRAKWLDTCLETAYIVGDALTFRPVRPLELEGTPDDSSEKGAKDSVAGKQNVFVDIPENIPGGAAKYFTKKKILKS